MAGFLSGLVKVVVVVEGVVVVVASSSLLSVEENREPFVEVSCRIARILHTPGDSVTSFSITGDSVTSYSNTRTVSRAIASQGQCHEL